MSTLGALLKSSPGDGLLCPTPSAGSVSTARFSFLVFMDYECRYLTNWRRKIVNSINRSCLRSRPWNRAMRARHMKG